MASKAMTTRVKHASDSDTPVHSDTPLYAVVKDGEFTLLDIQDTPCYTLTPDAHHELYIAELKQAPGQFVREGLKRAGIDTAWMDEL